jgi:ABC-type cobalt transport system substrate-binding protein
MNWNTKVREKAFEVTFDKADKYVYQPAQPFRLSGMLIWEPSNGDITSLVIANVEQLVGGGIPLQYFEAPFPIGQAQAAIEQNMLSYCLPDHFKGMTFPTCDTQHGTAITIRGSFKELMFWGIELDES